jgi:hypothetical protein
VGDARLGGDGGGPRSGLRTPLNAIIGLTEMMVTNAARFGTEKTQEPLQRVHRARHPSAWPHQSSAGPLQDRGRQARAQSTDHAARPLIDEASVTAHQLAAQNKSRLVVEVRESLGGSHGRSDAAAADPAQPASSPRKDRSYCERARSPTAATSSSSRSTTLASG